MVKNGAMAGAHPPVPSQVVHSTESTGVIQLFLANSMEIRKEPLGPHGPRTTWL